MFTLLQFFYEVFSTFGCSVNKNYVKEQVRMKEKKREKRETCETENTRESKREGIKREKNIFN